MKSSRRFFFVTAGTAMVAALVAALVAGLWWSQRSRVTELVSSTPVATTGVSATATTADAATTSVRNPVPIALHDPAAMLQNFNDWRQRYVAAADDAARAALVAEGVIAAQERRAFLREVIVLDPGLALRLAVSRAERVRWPAAVVALLEEPVSGRGDFNVIATLADGEPDAGFRAVRREAVVAGHVYDAYTYGRRARLATSVAIGLHGIAIDGRLALSDSPVRLLEAGESPAANRAVVELCAVSGLPSGPGQAKANDEPLIGADAGDRVYYLCSAGHIALLEDNLYAHENGSTGNTTGAGPAMAAAESGLATGAKRVLFIRVRFAGDPADSEPQSVESAEDMFEDTEEFLRENSFGALTIKAFITPVFTLPQTADWYKANDTSGYALNILQAARLIAAIPSSAAGNDDLADFNYLDYDFEIVRYNGGPGSFSGQGYVGMRGCWIKNASAGVLAHELGHNLGLWHANYWEPTDPAALTGAGRNREYGDVFSTMGSSKAGALHFNAAEKARLGWLPESVVATAAVSGEFRLHAHDLGGTLNLDRDYALRVPRGDDRVYWFEFRQHAGWALNPWLQNGLGVHWDAWSSSNGGTHLLDTTSGSSDGKNDSAVVIGRTYSDPVADLHVTPLRKNGTTPESLEVDVQIGPFPGNRAPAVQVSAPATQVIVGTALTLSASASDPDGDELAYEWDFGDRKLGTNSATLQHAWTALGDYRVRVTASDRKGGTATTSLLVRVGASTGARISGSVRDLAGQPVADARVATADLGAEDINYRAALTDADGTFTLVSVANGTWSFAVAKPGWAFAPLAFANPVNVSGHAGGIDFLGRPGGWRVTGVVRYADGQPVVGALVSDGAREEPTGSDGAFTFVGVPLGTFTLQATAPGAQFAPVKIEVAYGDTIVPTITEISGAPSNATARPDNTPPTFTQAAAASGPFDRAFVQLSARVSDDRGAALVRYMWSVVESAPGAVSFSRNAAHDAADTVAQFSATGVHRLRVTATDAEGASATSEIAVTIVPIAVRMAITPAAVTATVGEPVTLAVQCTDQFGGTMAAPADFTWTVNGGGTITNAGVFTPSAPGSGFVATASAGGLLAAGVIDVGYARGPGFAVTHETWPGLSGGQVRYLTSAAAFPDAPASVTEREGPLEFTIGETGERNYGRRVRGFFVPPATGEYVFRIASSNGSELWLGTSADPASRVLIASATVSTGFRQWSALSSQRSAPVRLIKDMPVYLEVLHKAGSSGSDHLSVGVELPGGIFEGPIPAHRLLPMGAAGAGTPPMSSWRSEHFSAAELADPAQEASRWGVDADPDGDGTSNLLEYAFGLDPFEAETAGLPQPTFVTVGGVEYLAITFHRNPAASDVTFTPQASSDLQTWTAGLVVVGDAGAEEVTYRDVAPAADFEKRFVRVMVTVP